MNETPITCNKTSDYNINDKNYYCYFNERISSYRDTDIFFNGKLIDKIFSSKKIDEAEFEISILNKTINFIEYKEVTLTNPNKDFYLDSIN